MRTEADHLIEELRRRHWTQYRWGPLYDPALLAWVYDFGTCADVIILREWGEDATQSVNGASGYRRPKLTGWDYFDPDVVMYQYHAIVTHTLRRMLTLPTPGSPGAPTFMERPAAACLLPAGLPAPEVIRPLGLFVP